MKRGVVLVLAFALVACTARKPPGTSPSPDEPGRSENVRQALKKAEDLEVSGNTVAALEQYDWAFLAEGNRDRQADILYRIACLRADPRTDVHDLAAAREELGLLVKQYPGYPRQRESQLMLALVNELSTARTRADSAVRESTAFRTERDVLIGQLKKAEEELAKIKEVLLKGTP